MSFTQAEAEAKVGKRVRSLVDFSGFPKGSTGKVVQADSAGFTKIRDDWQEVWDVVIEWEGQTSTRPIRDWFSKREYEKFLEEVSWSIIVERAGFPRGFAGRVVPNENAREDEELGSRPPRASHRHTAAGSTGKRYDDQAGRICGDEP